MRETRIIIYQKHKTMVKRLIFSLLVIFSYLTTNAQHLQFMGVNMGGDIEIFTSSLVSKGLTIYSKGKHIEEDWVTMNGDFWMFQNATFLIYAPYADKGTTFVQVSSRVNKSTFTNLVNSLDGKYGSHSTKTNFRFNGDAKYVWRTSKGNIELWRSRFNEDDVKCNLELEYIDYPRVKRLNEEKAKRSNDL